MKFKNDKARKKYYNDLINKTYSFKTDSSGGLDVKEKKTGKIAGYITGKKKAKNKRIRSYSFLGRYF